MQDTVLIVERDAETSGTLEKVVRSSGLEAELTESGEAALSLLERNTYALLLMAIDLGGMDGFETIARIRSRGQTVPIIIVSSRREELDLLYGLDIGADDYVTKPFNPVTLGAKIKAVIRRSTGRFSDGGHLLNAGPFVYNTSTLRLYKSEKEIVLTGKENAIMKLFLENINRIFPRDLIYDMVWGDAVVDENAVMVYINRLRQKVEDDPERPRYIQTVRGIGYRFVV